MIESRRLDNGSWAQFLRDRSSKWERPKRSTKTLLKQFSYKKTKNPTTETGKGLQWKKIIEGSNGEKPKKVAYQWDWAGQRQGRR